MFKSKISDSGAINEDNNKTYHLRDLILELPNMFVAFVDKNFQTSKMYKNLTLTIECHGLKYMCGLPFNPLYGDLFDATKFSV